MVPLLTRYAILNPGMRQKTFFPAPSQIGFTLIEMLISTGIMIMLLGGGIAAFITFNDRQTVLNAAKEVQVHLRSAQIKARASERPEACDSLEAYAVRMGANSNVLIVSAVCANGEHVRSTTELHPSVSNTNAFDLQFLGLHGGVNNPATITLTNGSRTYTVVVTQGGEIKDVGFSE